MRGWIATSYLLLVSNGSPAAAASLDVRFLGTTALPGAVIAGTLDSSFEPLPGGKSPTGLQIYWLKIQAQAAASPAAAIPVLVFHAVRRTRIELFAAGAALPSVTTLAGFRGTQDWVFAVPSAPGGAQAPLYARIDTGDGESRGVTLFTSTLSETLDRAAVHARVIALTVGALLSMALAALLIWFVMAEQLFILYSTLFFLQALYIAYLSGQGFDWPILSLARPLTSFAWNMPVGLSGAVSCLFTREITDLQRYSPRIYAAFGWLALVFGVLTAANLAKLLGFGPMVNAHRQS